MGTLQRTFFRRLGLTTGWLLYNWLITAGAIMGLPVLIVVVMTSEKLRCTFRQRLGRHTYGWESGKTGSERHTIWVHALSVGEVIAVQPLVTRLLETHAKNRIVLTSSTLTGYETAWRLFHEQGACLAYFPYDWIWALRQVIAKINPWMVILVETDIWPNFLHELVRRKVPVYMVNLRLSTRSWRHYRRFASLASIIFNAFAKICTQTADDAHRLEQLGVHRDKLVITGNLKFDTPETKMTGKAMADWRLRLNIPANGRVILAGSTHDGEEACLLDALSDILTGSNAPYLLIAPRDPGRAGQVKKLCRSFGINSVALSGLDSKTAPDHCRVIVVDRMGCLKELYSIADIAFVGGSMVPCGGHNPLEPAAFAKPILFGPDMSDFDHIAQWLVRADAARSVDTVEDLRAAFSELLAGAQAGRDMGIRARKVFDAHQGAVSRTLIGIGLEDGR
jgi:3-deoxy-D-manno-octulosonic-acid transferase